MAKLLYSNGHDANMLYAMGLAIHDPFYCIDLGEKRLIFLDSREYGVFNDHNENPNVEAVLLDELFAEIDAMEISVEDSGYGGRGFKTGLYLLKKYDLMDQEIEVANNFSIALADFLRAEGVKLKPVASLFPERMKKTPEEVAAIREALVRTQEAFKLIEQVLADSVIDGDLLKYKGEVLTSELMKLMVEREFVEQQLMNVEGMIISSGPHAAIPHHRGDGPLRPHQTIICDIFPKHMASEYYADMTRTYVKGEPSEYVQGMYEAVKGAQEAAFTAIRAGVPGNEVHQQCVEYFEKAGYVTGPESGFMHGTGHGLGLEVHEAPYFAKATPTPVEPGNVLSVEPGLYYPEHGGVRIEDLILVTEDGHENLTQYHKNYIID